MNLDAFWNDLHYEQIHFRDSLQFELQADVAPSPDAKVSISTQELYFFIPQALQINQYTYSKEQFYKDRTNLIRFKTPEFTFRALVDRDNHQSPLRRIGRLHEGAVGSEEQFAIQDEMKLLGNVVRSALRTAVKDYIERLSDIKSVSAYEEISQAISAFCDDIMKFREAFWQLNPRSRSKWPEQVISCYLCVDEFISHSLDYYLTGFLQHTRSLNIEHLHAIDRKLCNLIATEKEHRRSAFQEPLEIAKEAESVKERLLYHKGVLSKYVMDALLLQILRTSWMERYGNILAAAAAGIAMLIYVLLIFLNVPYFGFNSLPFLLLTVLLYILKDRVKDSLKAMFHQHAVRLFSDYTTEIHMPNGEKNLGEVKEFFSFVQPHDLPDTIKMIRKSRFEQDLPEFRPPETVLYYKKETLLNEKLASRRSRRRKLHNIFLFNVHLLLEKASDPIESGCSLDPNTMEIRELRLPKVYYLNIIMKSSAAVETNGEEYRAFRVVLDKNGIKKVEPLPIDENNTTAQATSGDSR